MHRRLNLFSPPPTQTRASQLIQLRYGTATAQAPEDEVKIRFASSMLAELAAGNWGWVYRVGLAGIAAAAGLGLGNLTAQPLHLVKERNFECAENRRKKESTKKGLSLSMPNHNICFDAQANGWRVIDHQSYLSFTSGDR